MTNCFAVRLKTFVFDVLPILANPPCIIRRLFRNLLPAAVFDKNFSSSDKRLTFSEEKCGNLCNRNISTIGSINVQFNIDSREEKFKITVNFCLKFHFFLSGKEDSMEPWPASIGLTAKPVSGHFVHPDLYLRLQKHSVSEPLPPAIEDESIVLFVTSGTGSITINGVAFPLRRGCLLWLQSYHTYTIEPEFGETLQFFACIYDYPLSSYLIIRRQSDPVNRAIMLSTPILQVTEEKIPIILQLFHDFEAENNGNSRGSATIRVAVLGQIVYFFINHCVKEFREKPPAPRKPLGWTAILYIAEHYREPLTAAAVGKYFGVTAAQLNRELRRICAMDFQHFLDRVRITIAAGAMFFEDVTLSYLLSYSGFTNESSFYRIFRKYWKMPPNEYRNSLLNKHAENYRGMVGSKIVIFALNYIQENYALPITQKQIAADLYTSEALLSAKFRETFGMSVKHVIALSRVRHSEPLLLNTDLPVLDIALQVGFNSAKVYTAAFRNIHSMTPTQFRISKGGTAP